MPTTVKPVELHPSAPPRRLPRPDGFKTASISVGFNGDAIRLLIPAESADAFVARDEQPGWASFPKTHTDEEYFSILSVTGSLGTSDTPLFGMNATFANVEILPGNEILVVTPRCYRNSDGTHELNAKVYNKNGKQQKEFLLGDGINDVQTNVQGHIWVSYFDEGVFGNFGWKEPFGAAGLSCFDSSGQKMWDYEPPDGFDSIADCYALNVCKSGAWACYYTEFPIARIDANWNVRCWKTESSGARTFAVSGGKLLMYGGYGEHRTECNLFQFDDEAVKLIANASLVLPRQIDLRKDRIIGRDDSLHVFLEDDWYKFSIQS